MRVFFRYILSFVRLYLQLGIIDFIVYQFSGLPQLPGILQQESDIVNKNVTLGPFLYCEREAFLRAGGFHEEYYAAEEFVLAKRMQAEARRLNKQWQIIRHAKGQRVVISSRRLGRLGRVGMALS